MKTCVLILSLAMLISLIEFSTTENSKSGYQYDVLVGGESDSVLKTEAKKRLTDLNLKTTEQFDSMNIQDRNGVIDKSMLLLYVLDKNSRNSLTVNEIAYLLGKRCSSLIIVFTSYEPNQMFKNEKISKDEHRDLSYTIDILHYLARRHQVKIYDTLDKAVEYIRMTFHNVESHDDDDDDLLDEQCMSDVESDINDADDEIIGEVTTETIETTTISEKTTPYQEDTVFFERKRRSLENEETDDNDESHATSNDDDGDDADADDDDYLSDQCEIESGFDLYDTDIPRFNSLVDQTNKKLDLDELFAKALERQNLVHVKFPDKLLPMYAWAELQSSRVCPGFLPEVQKRLEESPNSIDKEAFKVIANDCISFQQVSSSTCEVWKNENIKGKSSLYYGAFNLSTTEKPKYCDQLKNESILCYAPNLNYYDISQIGVEIKHLKLSRSKLIVMPRNNYASGLTLMASYLIGVKADKLFLDLHKVDIEKDNNQERFTVISTDDYNRGRKYLADLVQISNGVQKFAKNHTEALVMAKKASKFL